MATYNITFKPNGTDSTRTKKITADSFEEALDELSQQSPCCMVMSYTK